MAATFSFVVLIIFAMIVARIVVVVLGVRGTPVFSAPRCARCSYDLRAMNFMAGDLAACPECGSDLRPNHAVTYARLQRRPRAIIVGAILVGLGVAMFIGIPLFIRSRSISGGIGPTASQARTTPALIQSLSTTMTQPWDWQELERRLGAGSLSTSDVDAVVNVVVTDLNAKRVAGKSQQPLHWIDGFISLSIRRGDVSAKSLQSLCQAFYGSTARVKSRSRARQGEPFDVEVECDGPWNLNGMQGVWALRQVTAEDGSVLSMTNAYNESAPQANHPDQFSSSNNTGGARIKLTHKLPPGEHELSFTFDMGTVAAGAVMLGLDGRPGIAKRWPAPLTTWQGTLKQKLTIVPTDQSIVELVRDPSQDPLQNGGLSIDQAVVRPASRGVQIVLTWSRADSADPPLSYHVTLIAGDQKIDCGSIFTGRTGNNSSTSSMGGPQVVKSLPAEVKSIDVLLTPDPKNAERFIGVERIWGVERKIENVKLERSDLQPAQ